MKNVSEQNKRMLTRVLNKIDCPLAGRRIKTPFVMYVSAFTPRNRVPTVPEKQVDKVNPIRA